MWPVMTFFLLMRPVGPFFAKMWPAYETEFETLALKPVILILFFISPVQLKIDIENLVPLRHWRFFKKKKWIKTA